jgi:hypothetical protein
MRLIQHVWDHNREGTGFSWQRLNGSMYGAVRLAIEAGLRFDRGDFKRMAETMRIGYWGGNSTGSECGEAFYGLAIKFDHPSAYQSFEQWVGRKPFIWEGKRLYIGADFVWRGERVRVTNIKGDRLIACSYRWTEGEDCPRCESCNTCGRRAEHKIHHRYAITYADIRAARKAEREKQRAA